MSLANDGQPLPRQSDLPLQSLKVILALGVVCGCAISGSAPPPPLGQEETVARRMVWLDVRDVPREYLHLTSAPLAGPYYILVSLSGHYCVVPPVVYVSVHENQGWACDWRLRRPAN